jgi:transposase
LGNPLTIVLTGGQRHDVTQVTELLAGHHSDFVIADKGYDADHVLESIEATGAIPVIPGRKNRNDDRYYDTCLYRERHLVECFINKIKHYRRVFSRFDKLAKRYLGFLRLASVLIWLR